MRILPEPLAKPDGPGMLPSGFPAPRAKPDEDPTPPLGLFC
jgi:hypothetical protein